MTVPLASVITDQSPEVVDTTRVEQLALVTEMVAAAMSEMPVSGTVQSIVTELAAQLGCERVTIGWRRSGKLHLLAMSNNTRIESSQALAQAITAAMQEGLDCERTLIYPPENSPENSMDAMRLPGHARLAREQGTSAALTVPLHREKLLLGAICFERSRDAPVFDTGTIRFCEQLAALIAPLLDLRMKEERSLAQVARDTARARLLALFGPGHLVLKTGAAAAVALLLLLIVLPGQYRVAADAMLEGRIERVVAAPQKGYLQSVNARPGDAVAAGAELASLDDRDLKLERMKWFAKQEQVSTEFRAAMAERDRSKIGILSAQLEQAGAQLALVDQQLERLHLRAPFDGIVVSGDFTRELGSPLERGQVLFKIAPAEDYRVVLRVDESDVGDLREGARGRLILAAAPGEKLALSVRRITPVATAERDGNYFRVEATLDTAPGYLRPGMEGVAKLDIGRRPLIWIWTRPLVNWLRLKLWAWLP